MSSTDELPAYVDAFIDLNREFPGTNPFLYELIEALLRATKCYINEDTEVVMDTDTIINLTYAMTKLHQNCQELDHVFLVAIMCLRIFVLVSIKRSQSSSGVFEDKSCFKRQT